MKMNNFFFKIVFLYFYMYFIGPLIWGVWMVFRLKLITLQECCHCIFSPVAITMFISYFLFNLIYMKRLLNKASDLPGATITETSKIYYMPVLKVHCISIISFGTIGTFACLSMLSTNIFSFLKITPGDWLLKTVIGSLSGTSLVFLFYIMFSAIIITTATDSIKATQSYVKKRTLVSLKLFNLTMYIIGLVLFIGTATASLIYRNNNFIIDKDTAIFWVTLALPVFMSGLLYYKSNKRIDFHIKAEDNNALNIKLSSNIRVIFIIKFIVKIFFLMLFSVFLFIGKIQAWLFILIAGFYVSLILGRVYCGWCCPVSTVNCVIEFFYKLLGIKKSSAPRSLQHSLSGIICFALFLGVFSCSLILGKRLQIFTIITHLGVLVSSIFDSSFWCNYLCPWGTILKTSSKFSAFKRLIDADKCVKCSVCSLNCPSKSIRILDNIQSIEFARCLQCLQCTSKCHKSAIKMGRQ
jgi:ferredoxin-type protein NapH